MLLKVKHLISVVLAPLLGLVALSCCPFKESQPVRPAEVLGWKVVSDPGGFELVAVLLLNKGESAENGQLGVRVVDIIPGDPCAHPGWESLRKVELLFYHPQDRYIYGRFIGSVGTGSLGINREAGVSAIGVQEINSKENWVIFDLRR